MRSQYAAFFPAGVTFWQNGNQLTAQELQIAQLAAQGLSNRDIAQRLYLSHRTIGTHLYHIFPKLGITSRGELRSALSSSTALGKH